MPAGLIEHHDDMLVGGNRRSEAVEEFLHRLGIRVRHDEGKAVVGAGFDRCEDVGEREAPVRKARRALPAPPPDVGRPPLLADPRLILKEQPDALIFMRTLKFSEQRWGSF